MKQLKKRYNNKEPVSLATIKRYCSKYDQTGNVSPLPRPGRPRTARTPENLKLVKKIMKNKGTKDRVSHRKVTDRIPISRRSLGRMIKEVGLRKYKYKRVQKLTKLHVEKRKICTEKFLENFSDDDFQNTVFTDEAWFHLDGSITTMNSFFYTDDRDKVPVIEYEKNPDKVMVWGGISASGLAKLYFFPSNYRVNKENYTNEMLPKLYEEISTIYEDPRDCIFQQDGATAHTSKLAQAWLQERMPRFIPKKDWPPNSPDLNPCDYYLWGRLKNLVSRHRYKTLDGLKRAIKLEFSGLGRGEIQRACTSFKKRLELVATAEGGHIEPFI